ncbi:hypothetical protein E4T66_17150 [Sinimarinibacterium sp. CAU 1509]|uniref:hypothetical protein n=1 Tax=Sinimarinibacterium sp. CAU 1509 TaxID=2562283 RepID=UPI0010AD318B|nr:hypothetical protein [Sinimarinibacterium sp. CAU 1509]TJY57138.1 hypothetical protein E4T66_17150 [Sinimarinibacterium sp. CAU 1509]
MRISVTVSRTAVATKTFEVDAPSDSDADVQAALQTALAQAGDMEFSSHESTYAIEHWESVEPCGSVVLNADSMKVGDEVEFLSSSQTRRGPCSGRVVERGGSLVAINTGGYGGEVFATRKLTVAARRDLGGGRAHWTLA